jgi:hypothetical protein
MIDALIANLRRLEADVAEFEAELERRKSEELELIQGMASWIATGFIRRPAPSTLASSALRFGWPEPSEARVTVGGSHAVSYRLTLSEANANSHRRLRQADLMLVEPIHGSDAGISQEVAALLELAQTLPEALVARDGRFVRALGVEDLVREFSARLRVDPDRRFEEALEMKVAGLWSSWVEFWIGLDLDQNATRGETIEFLLPGGDKVEGNAIIHHQGRSERFPECERFTLDASIRDQAAHEVVSRLLHFLELDASDVLALTDPEFDLTLQLTTDQKTLQPRLVSIERSMRAGSSQPEQSTRATYQFEWHGASEARKR